MLAAVSIFVGILLGYGCGGSLKSLARLDVDGEWAILALFVVQGLARGPLLPVLGDFGVAVWGSCSLVLLFMLLRRIGLPGIPVAAAGIGANLLVVLANGAMPVAAPATYSPESVRASVVGSNGFYRLADERTILPLLGDVLPAAGGLASIGDVLLCVGVAVFLAQSMMVRNPLVTKR